MIPMLLLDVLGFGRKTGYTAGVDTLWAIGGRCRKSAERSLVGTPVIRFPP